MWRIDQFAYCLHGQDGSEQCGIGRVHFVDIPDAFIQIVPAGQEGNAQAYNVFDIRKCASGLNRKCKPTTRCRDTSCPPCFYYSATRTDLDGPKLCKPCQTCAKGEYASRGTRQEVRQCTRECPDGLMHRRIVRKCSISEDGMDAGSYVKATPTSIFAAGKPCATNEWYLGTRTPILRGLLCRILVTTRT